MSNRIINKILPRGFYTFIKFLDDWNVDDNESYEMYKMFCKLNKPYRLMVESLIKNGATLSEIKWKLKDYSIKQALKGK